MARVLIIGCGCRGRALAGELIARGHVVRGTTRDHDRRAAIEAVGGESVVADPDRIGTLARAFEHVAVTCVLLGSAAGAPAELAALHGTRLEMLLARMVDTTVRGVVYEGAGSVDAAVLASGAALVRERCADARIPWAVVEADPADHPAWTVAALAAVERTLDSNEIR